MTEVPDLELSLHHHPEANHYRVEARLRLPGSDAPIEPQGSEDLTIQLDLDALEDLRRRQEQNAYGEKLTEGLFGLDTARTFLARARTASQAQDPPLPLRLRLRVGSSAPELHRLRWELIHDPEKPGVVLTTDERLLFSRYLTSSDWRPVRTRPQAGIRALVLLANPSDIDDYYAEGGQQLAPVDVRGEWLRARTALGAVPVTLLCSEPELEPAGRPTLSELLAHLRDGYDILYLVAHGALEGDNPQLWLEDDDGAAALIFGGSTESAYGEVVPGLVGHLDQMAHLPRLVVLASCESALDTAALAALGPRLAGIGVPAVVAMQGKVTMQTVAEFMPVFFAELRRDGQIEAAMAAARHAARGAGRHDWWMPALYSRLESGRLFSARGQILGDPSEASWRILLENIGEGVCTPFLGPGVTADLLPSPADLAQTLAGEYHYPLPHVHDLARVGQFIAAEDNRRLRKRVVQVLTEGFSRRQGQKLDARVARQGLSRMIQSMAWRPPPESPAGGEIHHQLASLDLPLYLTTNFDCFMWAALRSTRPPEEQNQVRREVVPWRRRLSRASGSAHYDLDPPWLDGERIVLHLFGTDEDLLSMVLTEDDYLDYLTSISRDYEAVFPSSVAAHLASSSLLFLGYDLHDLALKVILRGLLANLDLGGFGMKHVAVQLEPSATDAARRQEVLDYLRKYFTKSSNVEIDVYWGSAHQFVADLHERYQAWQREVGYG